MGNNDHYIQWSAPAYKFSWQKLYSKRYSMGDVLSKRKISTYQDIHDEYQALYEINIDCLLIKNKFIESDYKVIPLKKISFFTKGVAPNSEIIYQDGFEVLYLAQNRLFLTKYIPMPVPPEISDEVIKLLKNFIKFYDNSAATKKVTLGLKIFSYIFIFIFIIFCLFLFFS